MVSGDPVDSLYQIYIACQFRSSIIKEDVVLKTDPDTSSHGDSNTVHGQLAVPYAGQTPERLLGQVFDHNARV